MREVQRLPSSIKDNLRISKPKLIVFTVNEHKNICIAGLKVRLATPLSGDDTKVDKNISSNSRNSRSKSRRASSTPPKRINRDFSKRINVAQDRVTARTCSQNLKSTDNLWRKSGNPVRHTSVAKSRVPDSSDIKPRAPVPRITSLCCVKPVVSTTTTPKSTNILRDHVVSKNTSSVQSEKTGSDTVVKYTHISQPVSDDKANVDKNVDSNLTDLRLKLLRTSSTPPKRISRHFLKRVNVAQDRATERTRSASQKLKSTDNLSKKSGNPVRRTLVAKSRVLDSSDIKPRAPVPQITTKTVCNAIKTENDKIFCKREAVKGHEDAPQRKRLAKDKSFSSKKQPKNEKTEQMVNKSQEKEEKDNIKLPKTCCKTFDISHRNTLGNAEDNECQHPRQEVKDVVEIKTSTVHKPASVTKSPVVAENLKERAKVFGDCEISSTKELPATLKPLSLGKENTSPDKTPASTKSSQAGNPSDTPGVSESVGELSDTKQQKPNESRKAASSISTVITLTCSEPVENTRKLFRDGENVSVSKIKSSLSLSGTQESPKKTTSESSKSLGNDRLGEAQTKKRVQRRKRPASVGSTNHLDSEVPIKRRRHLRRENEQDKSSFALLMKCGQVQDMDIESVPSVTSAPQAMEIETVGHYATAFHWPFNLFRPECSFLLEENMSEDMEQGDSGSSPLTLAAVSGQSNQTSPMSAVSFNQTNPPQTMEFEEGNNDLVSNDFNFFSQNNCCNQLAFGNGCGQQNLTGLQFDEPMEGNEPQQSTAPYFAMSNMSSQTKPSLQRYSTLSLETFSRLLFKLGQVHARQAWQNMKACENCTTLHKIYPSMSSLSPTDSVSDCSFEDYLELNEIEEMTEKFKGLSIA